MDKKVYLLSLTLSGIKNLRSELQLDFYKKTVNKDFDSSKHRVKAIYGENGCGKTAIITAAQIMKDLIYSRNCLDDPDYQGFLNNVINIQDKKLHLECDFYYYTEPANQIYHYTVELEQNGVADFIIGFEELTYRKADYPASRVSIAYSKTEEESAAGSDLASDFSAHMMALKELGASLCTNITTVAAAIGNTTTQLTPKELAELTRFIKVFKPELNGIFTDTSSEEEGALSDLILDYGGYQIRMQQEGNGIQNLIRLWPCLKAANDGRIVFIDSFDRDINEIYFDRLIKYFTTYAKGQLCCTVSNTCPMQELRKYKNSIDFLSSDGKITHWRTSGNFSPDSLYKSGMIERLPFNIEPEDFLGLMGD